MEEDRMLSDEILLGLIKANSGGGGGGGTDDYNDLKNQPKIENVTLKGNKTAEDLGLATAAALSDKVDKVDGKDLSTNDFTDAYKTAIGDNTTAINGIKNGEEINSFGGVESALALKQNATDNSLDTEAKTIVGAINENVCDISSLKSGLTDLTDHVDGDATTYPYADVITINDAVPANLADCSVKIEPVQDLHGYDKPWVGGAGKNKCAQTVDGIKARNSGFTWTGKQGTAYGITVTILTDNAENVMGYNFNGTCNEGFNFSFDDASYVATESITINGCPAGAPASIEVWRSGSIIGQDTGSGVTVEAGSTAIAVRIESGTNLSNVVYRPMIRLATETDATFAPYTNICPISGHTEAVVSRSNGNLLNGATETRANPDTGVASDKHIYYNQKILCKNGLTYYFSCTTTLVTIYQANIALYDDDDNKIDVISMSYVRISGFAITVNNVNAKYMMITFYNSTSLDNYTFNNVQLEIGDHATPYEPYSGQQYTIALGDTIYGGEVDFDTGVMSVTCKHITFKWSDYRQTYDIGDNIRRIFALTDHSKWPIVYGGVCNVAPFKSSFSEDSAHFYCNGEDVIVFLPEGTDENTDIEVVYELATPTTIQLTPQQIQLLKGTNTLYASTGQISVTVNGVSGAIGAVQEQVNGLAEEVAEIKPVDYSTTEQKTGQKWIDGKDIYCKTYEIQALPNNTTTRTSSGLSNLDKVVKIDGMAYGNSTHNPLPFVSTSTQYSIECWVDDNANIVLTSSANYSTYSGAVTLYYTKTA